MPDEVMVDEKETEVSSSPMEADVGAGSPSILNIIMLYLCLLGLGAIGGYTAFYAVFSERCTSLMTNVTEQHGQYRERMQTKYEQALEGQRQCMADTTLKDELSAMQGRLEAQSTLTERHQGLLQQQEDTLTRLGSLQAAHEVSTQTIATLREELSDSRIKLQQTKQALTETTNEKNRIEKYYRERLALMESLLQKHVGEIDSLKHKQEECDKAMPVLLDESSYMKNYIRQRNHQACKMEYGKGPFVVEFTLRFPETMGPAVEPNTFLVELASLAEMPHTVFTFLDLIDLQMFDGTAFVASSAAQIEGGSPNHAETTRAVKLYERYAKFGYSRTPLAFNEYSTKFPPVQFSVGFIGKPVAGPGLVINMVDNTETKTNDTSGRGGEPCFGRVVKGFDTLTRIQTAPKSADGYRLAKNIEIVSVKLVRNTQQPDQQQQQQQEKLRQQQIEEQKKRQREQQQRQLQKRKQEKERQKHEQERLHKQQEQRRLKKEQESLRIQQHQERERLQEEHEKKRQQQEQEKQRQQHEQEMRRRQHEQERKRQQQQKESKRRQKEREQREWERQQQ